MTDLWKVREEQKTIQIQVVSSVLNILRTIFTKTLDYDIIYIEVIDYG